MNKDSTLSKICSKNNINSVDKWQSFSKDFNNVRDLFFQKDPSHTNFSA